ncbi:MAG: efflux RND transporter periplasmic adaptor subunit [Bacteroidia bacterium]
MMNKDKKNKKLLLYGSISLAVLILIAVIGRKAGWFGKSEGINVTTAKVERKNIIETVSANGRVQPETEVKISSDVSGEITALYVAEGDSVVAGQLLARIDPELYYSALERAEASLNNSRANLASAKARQIQAEARFEEIHLAYERNINLHKQKLISDAEMETSRSAYLNAKAETEASKQAVMAADFTVKSFDAGLKEARKNLSRTNIYAPVSGIVSKLSVEKGERVVGTAQMTGTEMMRIANLNNMEVNIDVNENDILKVSLTDTAIIEVDAYPGRKFKGVVTEISNSATLSAATTSDQVINFVVKIKILQSSYSDLKEKFGKKKSVFRPGMSASVDIQTNKVYDALCIPIEAVTIRPAKDLDTNETKDTKRVEKEEDFEVVFVQADNKAKIRQVKTGIQDDKVIQIVDGLSENDVVIVGPYSVVSKLLKHNDLIKVVSKDELFKEAAVKD